jgi:hypothetical protein
VGGEVIGPPLIMERKGQRWLAKGKGFLASLHAKTHVFLVNLSRVSLRDGVQAVHDMTDGVGVAPVEVALSFTGAHLERTTVATTVGFDYKARATRTVRGRYQYKPGVALNEVFLVTQGVARQVKKQPRHVVRLAGPVVGLSGLDLKLDTAACGEVRVTIGSAEPVVLTSCDFKASGPPSKRAYTLKGKHEAIKKLTWSNASRSFQLVTKPLDVGIPVDTDDLVVPLDVRLDVTGPTGARTSLVATTQLVRSNARSKRWTH